MSNVISFPTPTPIADIVGLRDDHRGVDMSNLRERLAGVREFGIGAEQECGRLVYDTMMIDSNFLLSIWHAVAFLGDPLICTPTGRWDGINSHQLARRIGKARGRAITPGMVIAAAKMLRLYTTPYNDSMAAKIGVELVDGGAA